MKRFAKKVLQTFLYLFSPIIVVSWALTWALVELEKPVDKTSN